MYNILAHYVFAMPCSIVSQEKKAGTLYNVTCKKNENSRKTQLL
jgi:hypothetical protein